MLSCINVCQLLPKLNDLEFISRISLVDILSCNKTCCDDTNCTRLPIYKNKGDVYDSQNTDILQG